MAIYVRIKKERGKEGWVYALYFVTVLSIGLVLYSMGLSYGKDRDTSFSPLFILAKAIDSSLRSFGGVFNTGAVRELAQNNLAYSVAVFTHYLASVILTALVAIKFFGRDLVNTVRVSIISGREKYIVVGASRETGIFLDGLDSANRLRTIVVLETKDKKKKKDFLDAGFAVAVIKEEESRKDAGRKDEDIQAVRRALMKAGLGKNRHDTTIVSMAAEDETNLMIAKIVTDHISEIVKPVKNKNGTIDSLSPEQEERLESLRITARILYYSLERTEHFAFTEYALGRVRFFNISDIGAREFINRNPITSLIPRQWINTEKARLYNENDEGRRSYRIGNIFVGFGRTNRQLLRESICNHQILGADYNALIIDKQADSHEKQFRNSAPGLFDSRDEDGRPIFGAELMQDKAGSLYFPQPEERHNIAFAGINVMSADFYHRIIAEIEGREKHNGKKVRNGYDLVSVFIALGDDKLSIETALELRQKLYERKLLKGTDGGEEYDRVRIFVRIVRESVFSYKEVINDENDIDSRITVFGADSEMIKEDHIVHEKLDFMAKRIANDYWKTFTGGPDDPLLRRSNAVTKWDSLTEFKRDSNRGAAMSLRAKLNLLGFELCEDKERKTETDEGTVKSYRDRYGLELAEAQREKKKRAEEDGSEFIDLLTYKNGKPEDTARNNLARLEHQRWVAIHLVNGWTKLPISEVTARARQNEKVKQHACITTMEGLCELREMQANLAVSEISNGNESEKEIETKKNKALYDADTVCYDFDLMDRVLMHIADSEYYVMEK